jgi:hypothetical protein
MKSQKASLFFFLFFLGLQSNQNCFSQIVFSKGYLITNDGLKTVCLIKNNDWLDSPKAIQYKLNESSDIKTKVVDSIKEFCVDNFSRYVKATVKIDRSPAKLNSLNNRKNPEWSEETLLLKELICGKASLWEYTGSERDWYFYSIDNSLPEQLVFKEYRNEEKLLENNAFRQQLFIYIQNEVTKKVDIPKLKYNKKSLTEYFKLYNSMYSVSADLKKLKREILNVKVSGSVNYSSLSVMNSKLDSKSFNFDNKFNWMAGFEFEYFLPFNRNTWSLIMTPTYEHIYNNKTIDSKLTDILIKSETRTFDIYSINFPIGGRYTKYLKNDSKYYIDLCYAPFTVEFKSMFKYSAGSENNFKEGTNVIVGAGYTYKKLGVEIKYHSSRELLSNYSLWSTNYPKVSLSVTYKLFKITR